MPEQQIQPRQTAFKVLISDLINGNYVQQEGWQPNYIQIKDKQISRVNLMTAVIDKQASESLITITLDDGSGNIQAKTFNEDIKKLQDINIGDFVLIIGKLRKYNEQLFIAVEIAKKVDPVWGKVRKLELPQEKNSPNQEKTPVKIVEEPFEEDIKGEIYIIIKKIDAGNGAEISEVLKMSNLDEQKGEELINDLLKQGEIYENRPGYLKTID